MNNLQANTTYHFRLVVVYERGRSYGQDQILMLGQPIVRVPDDYLTIQEKFGKLEGINLSYIGDGNNVANSLMICGALLGVNVNICSPNGFEADPRMVEKAKSLSEFGAKISISNDPLIAVKQAQVIYTDVWASMG